MQPRTVLIADDHEFIRKGIRSMLQETGEWKVLAEAADGQQAVDLVKTVAPDLIVMDIDMPVLNGLEAARLMALAAPQIPILILSMHDSEHLVRDVLAAGARGFILKSDAARDLFTALRAVASGKPFFSPNIAESLLHSYRQQGARPAADESANEPLTARETEVLHLLAEGKSNKDVASKLLISVRTVETHRSNIMGKLDLRSVAELVRYAMRNRITT